MKVEIDITEQDIKDLKVIRTYFGTNDKTMLEHMAYKLLDDLVKKLTTRDTISSTICDEWIHEERVKQNDDKYCPLCGKQL